MSNRYDEIMQQLGARPIEGQDTQMSDAQLDKMESDLGYPLPIDYREFLHCYGSYEIPYARFSLKSNLDGEEYGTIETICGWSPEMLTSQDDYYGYLLNKNMIWDFRPERGIELIRSYPPDTKTITWPKELILIGEDPGGNSICLAIAGLRPGAVFYWRTSGDVYLAADSFDEFMQSLSAEEED